MSVGTKKACAAPHGSGRIHCQCGLRTVHHAAEACSCLPHSLSTVGAHPPSSCPSRLHHSAQRSRPLSVPVRLPARSCPLQPLCTVSVRLPACTSLSVGLPPTHPCVSSALTYICPGRFQPLGLRRPSVPTVPCPSNGSTVPRAPPPRQIPLVAPQHCTPTAQRQFQPPRIHLPMALLFSMRPPVALPRLQ